MNKRKFVYDFSIDGVHTKVIASTKADAMEEYQKLTAVPVWYAKKHAAIKNLGYAGNEESNEVLNCE